jgi:hypothetical protein
VALVGIIVGSILGCCCIVTIIIIIVAYAIANKRPANDSVVDNGD